ncbi:MAG: hypothetical protein JWQ97_3398 [Phenylobacterium sp.]|nr:hypothetical protein [Phenylobacterium sp.]
MTRPELDHRRRAEHFHRRAQKAEGALAASFHAALFWRDAYQRARSNRNTLKRKLNRARAALRAARWADPVTRIIELGRLFP